MPGPRYGEDDFESDKPDYFKDNNKPRSADWRKHEADVERRTGDVRNRSSGAGHGKTSQSNNSTTRRRGSVSVGDNMGNKKIRECKATKYQSIKLQYKWLAQLVEQGLRMGRDPVLELRMEAAELPVPIDWVMIPARDYEDLRERAGD
jgi:hypothetical protein